MQTTTAGAAGWGIFFNNGVNNYVVDLSGFAQGALKFSVKTNVNLNILIKTVGGVAYQRDLSLYGVTNTGTWQDVVMPIKDFGAAVPLAEINSPFIVNSTGSGDFSIDNVRWELDPAGYTPTPVAVCGRKLLVNNKPFTVKGVAAEMTPVGEDGAVYDWSLFPANYNKDIPLMKAMGVNVIRSYKGEPTQRAALDALYAQKIYVVMGFAVDRVYRNAQGNMQVVNFGDPVVRSNIKARFVEMVHHWKNHPAILMWMFGNEVNAALDNSNRAAWYSLVDECAAAAHAEEGATRHPVTTANADSVDNPWTTDLVMYNNAMPNLDLWSLQLYRGKNFGTAFTTFHASTAQRVKPLLISEFGSDAYDARTGYAREDQAMQKKYLLSQWHDIAMNLSAASPAGVCVGGIVFAWRDGWWKRESGNNFFHDVFADWQNANYVDTNMNEEWWGVVGISSNNNERQLRDVYHYLWPFSVSGTVTGNGVNATGAQVKAVSSNNMGDFTSSVINGKYAFTSMPSGWAGTITPVKWGCFFTPVLRTYLAPTGVIEDKVAQDFVASRAVYTVSGVVTDAVTGKGVRWVEITNGNTTLAITGANGEYSFTKDAGWYGTIKPRSTVYNLTPASVMIPSMTASLPGINFRGIKKTYCIIGSFLKR